MSAQPNTQGFNIVSTPLGTNIDGCAFFKYKGTLISMSTAGRSQGGCLREVLVMEEETRNDLYVGHSVQECIEWVDENI